MKTPIKLIAVLALTTLFWGAFSAHAQTVAKNISYQGYLTDTQGNALHPGVNPTNESLEFRIWDESQGGTLIWAEQQNVSVLNGNFSTLLGNGSAIPDGANDELPKPELDTVFNPVQNTSQFRYLEVTMAGRTFLPRQRMVSAAFAFRAKVAEEVVPGAVGSPQIDDGSILAADIALASQPGGGIAGNQIADETITAGQIDDGALTLAKLAAEVSNRLVPAGSINAWLGSAGRVPEGWLICDGRSVERSEHPELLTAIGTVYGNPSATTFSLPDLRGMFLRGADRGRGLDLDRSNASVGFNIGNYQPDQFKSHTHGVRYSNSSYTGLVFEGTSSRTTDGVDTSSSELDLINSAGFSINATGGTETRPKNIAVLYIIKAH